MLDKQGRTPEEAAKYWEDAYWDMMFKKYCDLPVSLVQSSIKVKSFKDWFENQVQIIRHAGLGSLDLTIRQLKDKLKMKTTQEIVQEVTNIIPFDEIKAKMNSKLPPDGNWLNAFKPGTRFLAYSKLNSSSVLGDFILGTDPKELPAVYLGYENGPQSFGWRWHDPVKFCREFGLYSILEVTDGNIDKVPEGTVEGDGKPKIVNPVHEEQ